MWNFPLFPEQASSIASDIDNLYFFLIAISTFFTLLIFVLIAVFATRYYHRKRVNRKIVRTDYIKLELTWSIIPLLISVGIYLWGAKVFFDTKTPPADAMEIYVVGKQWMWKIQHPEGNSEINELHVPVGRTVKLIMTSQDVIHSFFIPAFRVKQDVLPGRFTNTWFEATQAGEYHLFCAEYCGTDHSRMIGKVVAMEQQAYERWLSGGTVGQSMAASGEQLFTQFGCASCHQPQGRALQRGPSLAGLMGSKVTLENGEVVTADLEYVRESILNPQAKVVRGYQRIMPAFRNQMNQEQLGQIIEYIRSLSGNAGATAATSAGTPQQGGSLR